MLLQQSTIKNENGLKHELGCVKTCRWRAVKDVRVVERRAHGEEKVVAGNGDHARGEIVRKFMTAMITPCCNNGRYKGELARSAMRGLGGHFQQHHAGQGCFIYCIACFG